MSGCVQRPVDCQRRRTLELWRAYKRSGDQRLRDRLVLTFAPMVKYIVYRKVREIPARCEVEDFISCGLEALIRSIDRYDPENDLDTRQDEIARSDVGSLNTIVLAEDDTTIERIDTLHSTDRNLDPEFSAMRERAEDRFRAVFERLPQRDRKVAVLLYVHNLTLREIGEILGVTESRV